MSVHFKVLGRHRVNGANKQGSMRKNGPRHGEGCGSTASTPSINNHSINSLLRTFPRRDHAPHHLKTLRPLVPGTFNEGAFLSFQINPPGIRLRVTVTHRSHVLAQPWPSLRLTISRTCGPGSFTRTHILNVLPHVPVALDSPRVHIFQTRVPVATTTYHRPSAS